MQVVISRPGPLQEVPTASLRLRVCLLRYLNTLVSAVAPLVDLDQASVPWSIAHLLRQGRHLLFRTTVQRLFNKVLDCTAATTQPPAVNVRGGGAPARTHARHTSRARVKLTAVDPGHPRTVSTRRWTASWPLASAPRLRRWRRGTRRALKFARDWRSRRCLAKHSSSCATCLRRGCASSGSRASRLWGWRCVQARVMVVSGRVTPHRGWV